jgi:hypothetical protein
LHKQGHFLENIGEPIDESKPKLAEIKREFDDQLRNCPQWTDDDFPGIALW